MTSRITAPVPGLNGPGVGGLTFVNSVAETDVQAVIDYCLSAGYLVEDADAPAAVDPVKPVELEDLSVADLEKIAEDEGIDLTGHKKSKDTRVVAIEAARAARKIDRTYVVTYKDADDEEQTIEQLGDDEDAIRAAVVDVLGPLEILSIDKKQA